MNTIYKGKFISVEGIEGVGKSSNIQFIAELITAKGHEVLLTREPGGTSIAEAIRQVLLHHYKEKMDPKTELLLLYAGRLQHVIEKIRPALAAGKWVVSDRFIDATFAYQGAGRGVSMDEIEKINQWTLGDFVPDCTLILDAPVEVAFSRISKERELDRFEKEHFSFFERVRTQYLKLAAMHPERYHVIDASLSLGLVQAQLQNALASWF